MTKEITDFMSKLKNKGYAVIIWTPEELKGVDPGIVEDGSIEQGHAIIGMLSEEQETASGYNPMNQSGDL